MIEAPPFQPALSEPAPPARSAWSVWGRRFLVLLVVGGVGATLWRLGSGFRFSEVTLHFAPLVFVTGFLVITNLLQAMAWVRLLDRMTHRRLPVPPILTGFMAGQLARYIPSGKVA